MDIFEQIQKMCGCDYVSDLHQREMQGKALSCLAQVERRFSPQEVRYARQYILEVPMGLSRRKQTSKRT